MSQTHQEIKPEKIHLRDLTLAELREFVLADGAPKYRCEQIAAWLYDKLVDDFGGMTNLSLPLRESLGDRAIVQSIKMSAKQVSAIDGTEKYLFELVDGAFVEAVMMRYDDRVTLCVSSQVGCPLDCVFCQTGKAGFGRNLTAGEILDQICFLKEKSGASSVNVVFMGMGEPLMNYRSLVQAIKILNDPEGLNTGSRRITVSTAGLPRRIRELANEDIRCSLAVSLNASSDEQRQQLMPAVARHTVKELLDAAEYFHQTTGRRVTTEYVLLSGVNTLTADAKRLGKLVRGRPFKVNLIPYNAGPEAEFENMPEDELQRFIKTLLPDAPTVTVRRSRGPDIDAACGQLWTRIKDKKTPAKET